jgi:hypothetical protein
MHALCRASDQRGDPLVSTKALGGHLISVECEDYHPRQSASFRIWLQGVNSCCCSTKIARAKHAAFPAERCLASGHGPKCRLLRGGQVKSLLQP